MTENEEFVMRLKEDLVSLKKEKKIVKKEIKKSLHHLEMTKAMIKQHKENIEHFSTDL